MSLISYMLSINIYLAPCNVNKITNYVIENLAQNLCMCYCHTVIYTAKTRVGKRQGDENISYLIITIVKGTMILRIPLRIALFFLYGRGVPRVLPDAHYI